MSTTVEGATVGEGSVVEEKPAPGRFGTTLEVIVSKIFPAGFGWQAASVVAGGQGFEADSMSFALTTGAGDFVGVLAGHSALTLAKGALGKTESVSGDLVAGLWLATAAFCSGTAWQPVVNFLHDAAHCSFATTVVGTGAATGFCFFAGLRLGRVVYAPLGLPKSDYANLCGDAMLSVSIGAATGARTPRPGPDARPVRGTHTHPCAARCAWRPSAPPLGRVPDRSLIRSASAPARPQARSWAPMLRSPTT